MAVLSKYVKPGVRVDITPLEKRKALASDEEGVKQYKTRVYDLISEEELQLNMPFENGRLILLNVGKEYELCFFTDSGLYQCSAMVTERFKSNNVFIVSLELTSPLRRFQRREYFRLNCILDMKCRALGEKADENMSKVEIFDADFTMEDGTIVDISGGGVRFLSSHRHEQDTSILFSFNLAIGGKDVQFKVIGRIIASTQAGNGGKYENRVQFTDIPAEDRESIIKYIFEEERKIRRKENR